MNPKPRYDFYPAHPGNFSMRPAGVHPTRIIIHASQGSLRSMRNWFASPDARASAHYGVGIDGAIEKYVDERDCAWHAGNGPYNRVSIGIECEAILGDGVPDFQRTQMDALLALCAWLCEAFAIPPDSDHVLGHDRVPCPRLDCPGRFGGVNHHTDPGRDFPWTWFYAALASRLLGQPEQGNIA